MLRNAINVSSSVVVFALGKTVKYKTRNMKGVLKCEIIFRWKVIKPVVIRRVARVPGK